MEETKYSNYLIADALFNNMMVSVALLSPAMHFVLAAGQLQPRDKLTLPSVYSRTPNFFFFFCMGADLSHLNVRKFILHVSAVRRLRMPSGMMLLL